MFLSSTSKVETFRVVVSPCTTKLPATYKSNTETFAPNNADITLELVKYRLPDVSTTFAVVKNGCTVALTVLAKLTIFAAVNKGVIAETTLELV